MSKIVFISCVKSKSPTPCAAIDFYNSAWFKKARDYARSMNPDAIYILSAEYGLVPADKVIAPYDKTLNKMGRSERKAWADKVMQQIVDTGIDFNDNVVFLAGDRYRKDLIGKFSNATVPLYGLPIGKQLQFMTEKQTD